MFFLLMVRLRQKSLQVLLKVQEFPILLVEFPLWTVIEIAFLLPVFFFYPLQFLMV
jgi:hypothetical protein